MNCSEINLDMQDFFVNKNFHAPRFSCYAFFMNFPTLISDLVARGYTYKTIGELVGMTGENIRALETNPNQQPRWRAGELLIALHKKAMRKFPKVDTHA